MAGTDSQKFWPWREPELVEKSEGGLFDVRYKDTIYRVQVSPELSSQEFWIWDRGRAQTIRGVQKEILFEKFLKNKRIRQLVTKESL